MKKTKKAKKGSALLFLFLVFFSLLLVLRVVAIYVSDGLISTTYRDEEFHTRYFRGTLYDRNNNILAMDRTSYIIRIECDRVSEISRLSNRLSSFTELSAIELENIIRSHSGVVDLSSNIMFGDVESFNNMLQRENFDHYVTLIQKRERVYPEREHGRLIIGREGDDSSFNAESVFNERLLAPLSITLPISEGENIYLSLSERMQFITDHLVASYTPPSIKETLMLALLDYSSGEVYALSSTNSLESEIDFDSLTLALDGRDYTIERKESVERRDRPENIEIERNGKYLAIRYYDRFAIVSLSSNLAISRNAALELESLL